MTKYIYDEEAGGRLQMDVVHEDDDRPVPVARWVEAMRRLNSIEDPLARRIVALHRSCGSGSGTCDADLDVEPVARRTSWGCETTALVAQHFGIQYPSRPRDTESW